MKRIRYLTNLIKTSNKFSLKSFRWECRCSMETDGRTDMTTLAVGFCIQNASTNENKPAKHRPLTVQAMLPQRD